MSTVQLNSRNRVVGNTSIQYYPEDGHYYDFNGGVYFRNTFELRMKYPDLQADQGEAKKKTVQTKRPSSFALMFRKLDPSKAIDKYLPYYDIKAIRDYTGLDASGNLAVFWDIERYSMVQVRGSSPKWKMMPGSDSKVFEHKNTGQEFIYMTFGTGEMLLMKSMGLDHICFASDGAIKNTPYEAFLKHTMGQSIVRVIHDNDEAGKRVYDTLSDLGIATQAWQWKQKEKGCDLRDLSFQYSSLNALQDEIVEVLRWN